MSQARIDRIHRTTRVLGLVVLLCAVVASIGCGGAISSSHNQNGDPLHLGADPGPLGSTTPQMIEVRLGSEPSDRIVSLSLTANTLKAVNSGLGQIDLLTAPVTFEFTRSAIVTEPIFVGQIYQDTYSALVFPDMTGQVVFYDSNGQLTTEALSVSGQTISVSPNLVLGATPKVFSVSLDLKNSFTVGASSVTVNSLVVAATSATPTSTGSQPETGSSSFLVGNVTAVDTTNHLISLQPTAGNAMQMSYDGGTAFVECDPTMLTGMMIETESVTETDGTVMASQVVLIENSASSSELYGVLGGYAPDGFNYDLIVDGGLGANVTTGLIGKTVTLDWLAASYSVNTAHLGLDLAANDDLVFDETHAFPGQFVQVERDTLLVPDPDAVNAGFMQPRMFELEEQTISGTVSGYVYDSETQTGTFILNVASDSAIKRMNGGLISITVRQLPQTYLRNSPTFVNGDSVKVRGLLFAGSQYSNANYQPPTSPVAFILVADRISK